MPPPDAEVRSVVARTGGARPIDDWAPRFFEVASSRHDRPDTVTIGLVPCDDEPVVAIRPGQFNMLWAFGVGEVPISVCAVPESDAPMLHTIRAVGASTRALCDLRVGEVIGVRGPFGTTWWTDELLADDTDHAAATTELLIVAGGLGLAPLRPAVVWAAEHRRQLGRVTVVIGATTPAGVVYAGEFDRWRASGVDVRVTVDRGDPWWDGSEGLVTSLLPGAVGDADRTVGLVCGPEIMMSRSAAVLTNLGVGPERIQVSLERNMECGTGLCGHCQLRSRFLCRDGPVVPWSDVADLLAIREL